MQSRLVPLLAALLLVAASGCTGIGGDDTTEAQRVQEQALQSMGSVDTYRFEVSMSIESQDGSTSVESEGAVDRTAGKLRMSGPLATTGVADGQDATVYFDDGTAYVDTVDGWQTYDISERDVWNSRDLLARQHELLNASTVTLVGNDTVDGTPVRVLELSPDEAELRFARETTGFDGSVDDVTYRYYVASETFHLHEVEIDATTSANGTAGSVSMTMQFGDFGGDVSIEIPDEATGA